MIVAPIEIGIRAKNLNILQRFYIKALGVKVVSDIDVTSFPVSGYKQTQKINHLIRTLLHAK